MASKKVNREKDEVLEDVLNRRVVASEAGRLGLASTPEFKSRAARAEAALYFDAFLRKVIVPDVKVEESDLRAYLAAHPKDFTGQEEIEVEAIAFAARKDAEAAQARVSRGADFAWTKTNAGGQVSRTDPRLVEFPTGRVAVSSFPVEIRKALEGAREGDVRICGEGGGPFYVLHVKDHEPAKPLTLEAVRENVENM